MAVAISSTFAATAASHHGAISRVELGDCGLTRDQIRVLERTGVLERRTREVFVVAGSPDTWERRLWTVLLEAGPGAIASHRSAARLLTLPGFDGAHLDVTVHETRDHPVRFGTLHTSSWLPPHHWTTIAGFPCSTLARCLFELAGLSSPKRLRSGLPYVHEMKVERTYDNATKLGLTLSSSTEVLATLAKRGRPGSQLMRRLVDERGEGLECTESELEDLVLAVIAAHCLPLPECQVVLGGGAPAGRVDFLYRDRRLVIEADSRKHHTALLDRRNDGTRDLELTAAGFDVIRVSHWDLVHQPWKFIAALRKKLAA